MTTPSSLVILGSDHNGALLKAQLAARLWMEGYHPIDLGPFTRKPVDYTTYAAQASEIVSNHQANRAILICGTGVGMSIVANKTPGVRCALVHNMITAEKSREHNAANVLALGSWITDDQSNIEYALRWLSTPFGEGRHVRRVEDIEPLPKNKIVFTNGVFDLLHSGHIAMLEWARKQGERLIVAINSDKAVKTLKGEGRPIVNENDRASALQALRCVDEVIIFDERGPNHLIKALNPNVIVRGNEFSESEVRERDGISSSTEVKLYPLVEGVSTTSIVEQIRAIA